MHGYIRFYVWLAVITAIPLSHASVVRVTTPQSVGQGFLYPIGEFCLMATPKHVVSGQASLEVLTATRETFQARLINTFDIDMAVAETGIPKWQCPINLLQPNSNLSTLLTVYDSGVLKTMIEDGSLKQTKVQIIGVENTEYLEIRPVNGEDKLKQGQSGSMLYVADLPAGILIELLDGNGLVYRSDALATLLTGNNGVQSENAASQVSSTSTSQLAIQTNNLINIGDHISQSLALQEPVEYKVKLEVNSPIVLQNANTRDAVRYNITITDPNSVSKSLARFESNRKNSVGYTPLQSGVHTIKLTSDRGSGSMNLKISQWALDSELTSQSNVITPGGVIKHKLAKDATARYKMKLFQNSPIQINNTVAERDVRYNFKIIDSIGIDKFNVRFESRRANSVGFTPEQDGVYTIEATADRGYGDILVRVNQWALDSELTSQSNVITPGGVIKQKLAKGATARYKMKLFQNSPIQINNTVAERDVRYNFKIIDPIGIDKFNVRFESRRANSVGFTPEQDGVYTLEATADRGYGDILVRVNQWALDTELTSQNNVIMPGGVIKHKLATGATARYKMKLFQNSPIQIHNTVAERDVRYNFKIIAPNGIDKFNARFESRRENSVGFTPEQDGVYTIEATADRGYGDILVRVNQWALDSELRGSNNTISLGEMFSANTASGAKSLYRLVLNQGTTVTINNIPGDRNVRFVLSVLGPDGLGLYGRRFESRRKASDSFVAPTTGEYQIVIEADHAYGDYKILLSEN